MRQFILDYGALILTVFSGIGSVVTAIAGWAVIRLIGRIDKIESELTAHRTESSLATTSLATEVRGAIASVATDIKVATTRTDALIQAGGKLEGKIEMQQKTLRILSTRISKISGKLIAVFRHIEAPKRATDSG